MGEVPLYTKQFALVTLNFDPPSVSCEAVANVGVVDWEVRLQDYLARKKQPAPPGPP